MPQTPEGKVKAKVKALFKKHGVYYFMPVQTGYGASTLDFLACHHGRFIAVETKAPGKKLTPRQEIITESIYAAGGVVFHISDDDSLAELNKFLDVT